MKWGYFSKLKDFVVSDPNSIVGQLVQAAAEAGFSEHRHAQTHSWTREIAFLRATACELTEQNPNSGEWAVFLEYEIPRRDRRIDTVLLAGTAIVVIEFKVGATSFDSGSLWQVTEYALDLRDFHEASSGYCICPILVASDAPQSDLSSFPVAGKAAPKLVAVVVRVRPEDLGRAILLAILQSDGARLDSIDPERWANSVYRPAVNIIEAAEAIFSGHHVREIAHAASDNLTVTGDAILTAVRSAQDEGRRLVCLVTGVPGAGKTLVGLKVVHNPESRNGRSAAVFLSGNGPLVRIVRTALVRDRKRRPEEARATNRVVSTFIQNVHQFLKVYGSPDGAPPPEHVVVFDEAQRAWDSKQMVKKGHGEWSEPELMLKVMERCPDWSVIVALVGGGQEIHTGEAGLPEWGRAILSRSVPWDVLVSPEALAGGASVSGQRLFPDTHGGQVRIRQDPSLHLSVSIRSFRAKVVGDWVNAVLDGEAARAKELLFTADEFPLVLTRDLNQARAWLRLRSLDERRGGVCGLVASSGALRLRAFGLEVSSGFRRAYPYEDWFLANPEDVRSSSKLEVAATEFECQGLELDWAGVCWGGDFVFDRAGNPWSIRRFVGSRWNRIKDPQVQQYVLNKYRVLLTRARCGMVVWIPKGDPGDPTTTSVGLDDTAEYFERCGLQTMDS